MDLWRLWTGSPANEDDLIQMVELVVAAAVPDAELLRLVIRHPSAP
jgi:hypothetical protein